MSMTTNRPETVDQHGTRHRYGCRIPGWTSEPSPLRGWHICRCSECGAVRLARAGGSDGR